MALTWGLDGKVSIFQLTVMEMPEIRFSTERKLSGSATTTSNRPGLITGGLLIIPTEHNLVLQTQFRLLQPILLNQEIFSGLTTLPSAILSTLKNGVRAFRV